MEILENITMLGSRLKEKPFNLPELKAR